VTIAVVDSGSGNLRSVAKALERAGEAPVVTSDPEVVRRADRVVVPGQGAFGDCMAGLTAGGLADAVKEVIAAGRPYLGICLGLQVLFDESEEHGPVRGLGLLGGRVVAFTPRPGLKVPHMGWNAVSQRAGERLWRGLPDPAYVYFVHSYHAVPDDARVTALSTDYGGPVCAAVRHENLFATQFHPEKSGAVGLALLENFVRA
jgi:imidazole glycerol-phosphate synthase subunit HisH